MIDFKTSVLILPSTRFSLIFDTISDNALVCSLSFAGAGSGVGVSIGLGVGGVIGSVVGSGVGVSIGLGVGGVIGSVVGAGVGIGGVSTSSGKSFSIQSPSMSHTLTSFLMTVFFMFSDV